MNTEVILAQFCYVARFLVTRDIMGDHLVRRGWKKLFSDPSDSELFSGKAIEQHVSAYLGSSRQYNGVVSNGSCYTAQVCDLLSAFNNKPITLGIKKKESLPLKVEMHPTLQIHLSPDKKAGMLVIGFNLPWQYPEMYRMKDVIDFNYAIQKIDKQAPRLLLDETGAVAPGFETLMDIIRALLPEDDCTLSERFRLHPAVYIHTPMATDKDYDELVYLAGGQNEKYQITGEDKDSVEGLYRNVHTLCRIEGFAACCENPDPKNKNSFESQFLSTFRASYLPLYLCAGLADYSLTSHLRDIGKDKISRAQSEWLRELKLMVTLPSSPFTHLNKQASIINRIVFNLPAKVESISEYSENARFELQNRSERRLNLCVMALTVSQVIFALIQYLGIKDVLGEHPQPFQNYSVLVVAGTILLVVALLFPWEKIRKQ